MRLPLVDFPRFWLILVDSLVWAVLQPAIGWLAFKFPDSWIDFRRPWYQSWPWEEEGHVYQRVFAIRSWKDRIPSGGRLYKEGFSMDRIKGWDENTIQRWITESCRAELCHWMAILPSAVFFLWNPWHIGIFMVVYALAFNAIPIIIQRYNRPRLLRVLERIRSD
jgi:glycosyl-4,4'-diaponeurosporenoate acyltransferase